MVRLGVIGCGRRISNVINHYLRKIDPDLHVVAIIDPDETRALEHLHEDDRTDVKFYKSVGAMMRHAKLDAVAIGTRCNLHTPYAIQLAKYTLPLYLEKPVSITMPQARQLERAFAKSKCPVVVSFPLRVTPLCRLARATIEEGAVGSPEHILGVNYVTYGSVYFESGYRDYDVTGGLFLQKATHDLDYMMYLMDSPIVRVAAMHTRGRVFGGKKRKGLVCSKCKETETCPESPQNRARIGGSDSDHLCTFGVECGTPKTGTNEDSSSVLIEFASGVHGVYTQVFYSRRDAARRGSTVSGYTGTISFDWYREELTRVRHHEPFTDTIKSSGGAEHFGGDRELAQDFMNIIYGKGESRTTIWHGLQSAYACLAARESANTGEFVAVRQTATAGR